MLTILLSILFSKDLTFANLTVQTLLNWYNTHPFIAIIAIFDIALGTLLIANILTSFIMDFRIDNDMDELFGDFGQDEQTIGYAEEDEFGKIMPIHRH